MSRTFENPEAVREATARWKRQLPNLTLLPRPKDYPERQVVSTRVRQWNARLPYYQPPEYTSDVVKTQGVAEGWADPEDPRRVVRADFGTLRFDRSGRPLNPAGRAGIAGRGGIGRWGESDTTDGIVTRDNKDTKELLVIRKAAGAKPALPGGFIEFGEELEAAAAREVREETGIELPEGLLAVRGLFTTSQRTTDHAWIVTNGYFVEAKGSFADQVPVAGDDAAQASWEPLTPELLKPMSAHHAFLARLAVENS